MHDELLDKKSIFSVFTECRASLKKVVQRYSNRESEIDDILQEAFLRTFAANKVNTITFPKSYLYTTTKNIAVRENSKVATKITEYIEDSSESLLISEEKNAFDLLSAEQERAILLDAIKSLPTQCQRVTKLRLIDGVRIKDIARQLNISVSTTEKHISKGLLRCDEFIRLATSTTEINKQTLETRKSNYK
jgi:RNA polymerase sigma-70 factor (ECF subfamily)